MSEITKYDASGAGCIIDGHWGQYGVARMVEIASEHGYGQSENKGREYDIFCLSDRKLAELRSSSYPYPLTDEEEEKLSDAADSVELWMNENIAPEGYQFGWEDGEFFFCQDTWWNAGDNPYEWDYEEYEPQSNGWDSYPEDTDNSDPYDIEYDVP